MKICYVCKEQKSLDSFNKDKRRKDGKRLDCKSCIKQYYLKKERTEKVKERELNTYLKRTYGISKAEYDEMAQLQNNLCKICNRPEDDKIKQRLVVDHCHKTGKVRSLLCRKCNASLGLVKENITILKEMIKYIGKYI